MDEIPTSFPAISNAFHMTDLLTLKNLIVIIAIQGLTEALKATVNLFNSRHAKWFEIILTYLPMFLGAVIAFVPNILNFPTLGERIVLGVALGAIGGQVWKILKTKLDLLKGKL
jgi:hypothetical protein